MWSKKMSQATVYAITMDHYHYQNVVLLFFSTITKREEDLRLGSRKPPSSMWSKKMSQATV